MPFDSNKMLMNSEMNLRMQLRESLSRILRKSWAPRYFSS